MFRDLKEYREIAKIYAEKVSKSEELDEMTGGLGVQGAQKMQKDIKSGDLKQKPVMEKKPKEKTFIEKGYFEKSPDSGLYSLSKSTYSLCENVLGRRSTSDLIQPYLDGLSAGLKESAAYFDFDGEWVTLLAKSEVANSYHYLEVNSSDVHSPINGFFFACLPFIDQDKVQEILNRREDYYGYSKEELTKNFGKIRRENCHVSQEVVHRSQVTRICAPVFEGKSVKLSGVLGVTIISHDISEEDMKAIVNTVKVTAQNASNSILES